MATRKTAKAAEVDPELEEEEVESAKEDTKPIVPKEVDLNQLITVRNGYNGRLIYVSARTGERFVWDSFGDEQEIELRELRNAKSSAKAFFRNNYFMFSEENSWVINYLGLSQFYANAIKPDEFEHLFDMPAEKLRERISKLTKGQQKTVGYMARQKVLDGAIDSRKTISTLEEVLGIQLVEH